MKTVLHIALHILLIFAGGLVGYTIKSKKIIYVPVKDYSLESKKDSIAREVIAMPLDSVVDWYDRYLSE